MSVEPTYLETRSSPENAQYLWAYRVIIENQGRETVQLLSRHWMITNARGELTEVKGPGVVGEQPILKPGQRFEYTSGAPLNTPSEKFESKVACSRGHATLVCGFAPLCRA